VQSVLRLATGWTTGGVRVRILVRSTIFSSPRRPDRLWRLPNLLFNGYRGLFPRLKRPGREENVDLYFHIRLHGVVLN
jgi:hypothetical protein